MGMVKAKQSEVPAVVKVHLPRPVRVFDGGGPGRDIAGEQELEPVRAVAWQALGWCQILDGYRPDPTVAAKAAERALESLDVERTNRGQTQEEYERIPANRRRLEAVLALVTDNGGPQAA